MPDHKSEDYKKSAVDYYLISDESQVEVCKIFKYGYSVVGIKELYALDY